MTFTEYLALVRSDLNRYNGQVTLTDFISIFIRVPGFKYSFWMRTCSYLRRKSIWWFIIWVFCELQLRHLMFKFGMTIPSHASIDSGLYIGHFGGIVVSHMAVIGKNCNISQGVTIGQSSRGERKGFPTIGNNVFIGPGAKIFGNVYIGDNAAIGANCVVTKDIPSNAVVVGIPGNIISYSGSSEYVINTEQESNSSL